MTKWVCSALRAMNNRAFRQLMDRVKDAPELGGGFSSADVDRSRERLWRELGWNEAPAPRRYTVWDYLEYLRWEARHAFLRPLAMTAAVAGLMLGGFITTVSASGSRPGDILYPVKLAAERLQLSLANSPEQRLQLHADFAAARLQEAVDLSASNDPGSAAQVKAAVDGFKNELSSAHSELSGLAGQAPAQAAAAASLASKADAFAAVLSQSAQSAPGDVRADVVSAQAAAENTQTQAVRTLVKAYEDGNGSVPAQDVQRNFRNEYQDVSGRLDLALGRLSVMRAALNNLPASQTKDFRAFVASTQTALQPLPASLSTAQDVMAAGGYSHAFDLLNAADKTLASAEQQIVDEEIKLSTLNNDATP